MKDKANKGYWQRLAKIYAPLMESDKKFYNAICGYIREWTLSAYVRDAAQMGMNKGMLVLGHERSEEWGMKHLPVWLHSITGDLPVNFVDAKEPFTYIV